MIHATIVAYKKLKRSISRENRFSKQPQPVQDTVCQCDAECIGFGDQTQPPQSTSAVDVEHATTASGDSKHVVSIAQARTHSIDEIDDYMGKRTQRASSVKRPSALLETSTTNRDSGANYNQIYSLQVSRAKCKTCFNIGHSPILRIRVHSLPRKGETRPELQRQQVQRVHCCMCGAVIATTHSFNGYRSHLDVRDLLQKAITGPRDYAYSQQRIKQPQCVRN
mmetsp:Transcript_28534/g.54457  ORF Transcript_28534/g.54457 Transcript_28534/m.54457 type:complete len:223 (-) Transcript_28534:351-1019(-)